MDKLNDTMSEEDTGRQYDITAVIKATCSLDPMMNGEYRTAVTYVRDFREYLTVLKSFIHRYPWTYYNRASDTEATKKDAVNKETRREIDLFSKEQSTVLVLEQLRDSVSTDMKELLQPVQGKLSKLTENENNDIGLTRGNVSIAHDLRPNVSVGEAYVTEVRDTNPDYIIPLEYGKRARSRPLPRSKKATSYRNASNSGYSEPKGTPFRASEPSVPRIESQPFRGSRAIDSDKWEP